MIFPVDFLTISILTLLYSVALFIEQIALISNIAGKIQSKLSQGLSFQHATYALSRAPIPIILVILSYLIETNISLRDFVLICFIMCLFATFGLLLSLKFINPVIIFYQRVIIFHESNTLPRSTYLAIFSKASNDSLIEPKLDFSYKNLNFRKTFFSCIAFFFLGTAFLFSFSFANYFIEFRLTISQLTNFLQGFAVMILSFYINPMFSRSIDQNNSEYWMHNFYSIYFGRVLALITATILFGLVLLMI